MGLDASLEARLEGWWRELASEYEARTPISRGLFERARRVLPGGTTYHIRYYKPYPAFVARAKGPLVWDVDGNVYDDYWMGHGTHVLGHAPDFVLERVRETAARGTHFGYLHELLVDYAELLTKIIPGAEMVRFCNSGTEANMYALRLARAYTGRKTVVKMEGGWHGAYDALHVGVSGPPYDVPESLGLPQEAIANTRAVPFNDPDALERVLKREEVAAILLEPVMGAAGCLEPEPGYLKEVRRLADEHGALLIFDEVITGFRLAPGGAQEFFNVKADLVVLGKIVGGGFPGAGAFLGPAEIMELLDHLKRPDARQRSAHGGTFTGNPITLSAGYALVKHLAEHPTLYERFNRLWERVREKLNAIGTDSDLPVHATGAGSLIGLHFTTERPRQHRTVVEARWSQKAYEVFHLYARLSGILYMTEANVHFLPSMAHSEAQADKLVETVAEFLEELKAVIKVR